MRRNRSIVSALLYSVPAISLVLSVSTLSAREESRMVLGIPRADQALVYFIRPQDDLPGRGTTYLFSDDSFLGVVDGVTYGFAYVEPGEHLFWSTSPKVTKIIELVPGETYFLDVWTDISLLEAERGMDLIRDIRWRRTPNERETAKAERYIEKRYSRAQELEARKNKEEVGGVEVAPPPDDTTRMMRVPARTPLELELMENVCPATHDVGDSVWFRVVEDAAVDGRVYLMKETLAEGKVIYIEHGKAGGYRGSIDVSIPAVPAVDQTAIPLVAQMAWSGESREKLARRIADGVGIIWSFLVKGKEAYRLSGERIRVTTREDVWVNPRQESTTKGPVPAAASVDVELNGWSGGIVKFAPASLSAPADYDLYLDTDSEPVEVRLQSIGGWSLPERVLALSISRNKKLHTWACTFRGRELVRFMRLSTNRRAVVSVLGKLETGETFSSTIKMRFELKL